MSSPTTLKAEATSTARPTRRLMRLTCCFYRVIGVSATVAVKAVTHSTPKRRETGVLIHAACYHFGNTQTGMVERARSQATRPTRGGRRRQRRGGGSQAM